MSDLAARHILSLARKHPAIGGWVCGCPTARDILGRVNSARYFIRREDDEPPCTPPESPFRRFDVKCLKCGSCRLCLASEFDDEAGELRLTLTCSRCRQCEVLKAH